MSAMGEIFYWVLNMSISSALVGLAVMLIRCLPMLPRRAVCFLWLFPFLRLCIPVSFGSRYSIMAITSDFLKRSVSVPVSESGFAMTFAMNHIALAESYSPFTYKTVLVGRVFFVSAVIWLAVAVVGLLFVVFCYISELLGARRATRLCDNVYVSQDISSPVLVGIVRPKILVPQSMSGRIDGLVILHENSHAKSFDNLWRLLALVLSVIHWFNPFVWLFLRLYLSDIEYACDERVLSRIGKERRREYAAVLVDCAERRSILQSPFGGASLSGRIRRILDYRRLTMLSTAVIAVFVAVLAIVLMTNYG